MSHAADPDPEPEELLAGGRPLPRWVRGLGVGLVVALVVTLAVRAFSGSSGHRSAALPRTTSSTPTPTPTASAPVRSGGTPRAVPWPTARSACGDDQLPLVTGALPARGTGLTLLLGSSGVWRIDVDAGHSRRPNQPALHPDEYVIAFAGDTAVTTSGCDAVPVRTFSVGSRQRPVFQGRYATAYGDGRRTYVVHFTDVHHHPRVSMVVAGRRVRLPDGFDPAGVTAGVVVGTVHTGGERPDLGELADAASGRVLARIGFPQSLAAGAGRVIGTYGCDVSAPRPCQLRSIDVHGGPTRVYRLPRAPGIGGTVISPDGHAVAFALERSAPDPRYNAGVPLPPSDIAVLRLDTGRVEIVPGIELPPKASPGLAFSPDGRWLAIALDAGRTSRVLVWRSGLRHPYETARVSRPSPYAPAIEVVR